MKKVMFFFGVLTMLAAGGVSAQTSHILDSDDPSNMWSKVVAAAGNEFTISFEAMPSDTAIAMEGIRLSIGDDDHRSYGATYVTVPLITVNRSNRKQYSMITVNSMDDAVWGRLKELGAIDKLSMSTGRDFSFALTKLILHSIRNGKPMAYHITKKGASNVAALLP